MRLKCTMYLQNGNSWRKENNQILESKTFLFATAKATCRLEINE